MPSDQTPQIALDGVLAKMFVRRRHDSDGLLGHVSFTCASGLDLCTDRTYVCRCHNEVTFAGLAADRV